LPADERAQPRAGGRRCARQQRDRPPSDR
jgi:hypothetical protein